MYVRVVNMHVRECRYVHMLVYSRKPFALKRRAAGRSLTSSRRTQNSELRRGAASKIQAQLTLELANAASLRWLVFRARVGSRVERVKGIFPLTAGGGGGGGVGGGGGQGDADLGLTVGYCASWCCLLIILFCGLGS